MKIYITYSSEGIGYAQKLDDFLKSRDYDTFFWEKNIEPGDPGWIEAGKEMEKSFVAIHIITESSENSRKQKWEISLSMTLDKNIMPLVKSGIELFELIILKSVKIEYFTDSNLDEKFEKILSKINKLVSTEEIENYPEDQ